MKQELTLKDLKVIKGGGVCCDDGASFEKNGNGWGRGGRR